MTEDSADIGPDNGRRPSFVKPEPANDDLIGRGEGYSGQEYDSASQEAWRQQERDARLPTDGRPRGSGAGAGGGAAGEDFDETTPGGARPGG
ncbi:hypothetical protein ACFSC3_04060 [Sphingomonas floccifaciens]|uniref:Uncharacterized protein n=1 Tax=Sphingomonas floccifaciens TaxID=1844115 RepID=A0ABW4NA89_9SPHN